jgi:hypothetical protein
LGLTVSFLITPILVCFVALCLGGASWALLVPAAGAAVGLSAMVVLRATYWGWDKSVWAQAGVWLLYVLATIVGTPVVAFVLWKVLFDGYVPGQ